MGQLTNYKHQLATYNCPQIGLITWKESVNLDIQMIEVTPQNVVIYEKTIDLPKSIFWKKKAVFSSSMVWTSECVRMRPCLGVSMVCCGGT